MARIPEDELERLKREVSLVDLVQARGVKLEAKGKDVVGLCPFHEEAEPSFRVSPAKNVFHCFGCGEKGTVVDWVMKTEGVSFRHAVQILRAENPSLSTSPDSRPPKRATSQKLPPVVEADAEDGELRSQVAIFYHETLKESPEAVEYLESRGLDPAKIVDRFQLGYSNRTLGYHLPGSKLKSGKTIRRRLQELGIIKATGHELMRGSLTIPILGADGQVAQIYGRKIGSGLRPSTPRHLYMEGPRRGIWNLDALRESKEIILCECLLDALTFYSAGFEHVTASFGAHGFTDEMLEAFVAYGVERVLIAFDRDVAGDAGAEEVTGKLGAEGVSCFRVLFPKQMDANEYAQRVEPARQSLAVLLRSAEHVAGPMSVGGANTPSTTRHPENPTNTSVMTGAEATPPLAAKKEGKLPVKTQEIAASPEPPPASLDVPAEVSEAEVIITLADRRWRIRGLARNMSFEQLKVNLLVSRPGHEGFHVDTLDLYSARHRSAFVKQAAAELEAKPELVKKDLGKVLLKLEELQEQQIRAALEPKEKHVTLSDKERSEAMGLLKDPKLIRRVLGDLEACGLVREETNKLVAYLAAVSRKHPEPLAVMVQSSSAAGKSALMNAILAMTPEEERVQYSAMTGQSLFYMGEADLKHKVLAIAEGEGAEKASYALKLLQSEGELTIASTGKDPSTGRLTTHEYHVEGPAAIVTTTTAIDVDEELANRFIVLTVDEDREQTRAIHRLQRERRTPAGLVARSDRRQILKLHQNAQRLLRALPVGNPWASRLTFLDINTRTRRDHEKYLTLIEAVTLLHQHQRPVKRVRNHAGEEVEYVEVTPDDIAIANRLAAEVLGRTLDELPPQTRRVLDLVRQLVRTRCEELEIEQDECRFTRREVIEHSGLSLTQARVHLGRLVEMEYLLIHRGGRGQSFVYELLWDGQGSDGEAFVIGLIDVDKLRHGGKTGHYDANLAASSHQVAEHDPDLAGPWRAQNGPMAGSWRGAKSGATDETSVASSKIRKNPAKNAHLEPQKSPSSYRQASRNGTTASPLAAAPAADGTKLS